MTFLKVLKATNVGVRGPLSFGGKTFALPEFLRHFTHNLEQESLQGDDSAVRPELF